MNNENKKEPSKEIIKEEYRLGKEYYNKLLKEMPKNKEKLQNINRENHINNVDERKIFLRMKAGSLVYQLMTFVYLFVAFVLALLHIEAWIIGIIFGLFLLQTFLGIILYKHFEKHF